MKRIAALFITTMAAGCGPMIMTRPANVEAGGLDCVTTTLQRLGYMITGGDRSLGFVRAERTPGLFSETDILIVNYLVAGTVDGDDDTIQVRASRNGHGAPSRQTVSDAESLLDRCGKI